MFKVLGSKASIPASVPSLTSTVEAFTLDTPITRNVKKANKAVEIERIMKLILLFFNFTTLASV